MWWDSLRTAFQLAERVEECESRLSSMESDWTDIQDKLLAREERLRKRLSRELKASLESPQLTSPSSDPSDSPSPSPDSSQGAKRALLRQFTLSRSHQREVNQ